MPGVTGVRSVYRTHPPTAAQSAIFTRRTTTHRVFVQTSKMTNPKVCEVCQQEFDGRKTKCPFCAAAKAAEDLRAQAEADKVVEEANSLIFKREELDKQSKGSGELGVLADLARSMSSMAISMESMMGELRLTLQEARSSREEPSQEIPKKSVQLPTTHVGRPP